MLDILAFGMKWSLPTGLKQNTTESHYSLVLFHMDAGIEEMGKRSTKSEKKDCFINR